MPVVERLSRNMIEKFLNSSDYGYLRDKDGDLSSSWVMWIGGDAGSTCA